MTGNVVFFVTAIVAGSMLAAATPSAPATHYANCAALRQAWPHGVGKAFAIDRSKNGEPVKTFHISSSLYKANEGLDGDHDGIACEKH